MKKIIFLFLLFSCSRLFADMEPEFDFHGNIFGATDIVVATAVDAPQGKYRVLETWKGELKKNTALSLDFMKDSYEAMSRMIDIDTNFGERKFGQTERWQRIVIYMTRCSGGKFVPVVAGCNFGRFVDDYMDTANYYAAWAPICVAWIMRDTVYTMQQWMNPGPVCLLPYIYWSNKNLVCANEKYFHEQLRLYVEEQKHLDKVKLIQDNTVRADSLKQFFYSGEYNVVDDATLALSGCGNAAVPVLRAIRDDTSLQWWRKEIFMEYGTYAGEKAVPVLEWFLQEENAFWKLNAPLLDSGWWNRKPAKMDSATWKMDRDRIIVTMGIMGGLVRTGSYAKRVQPLVREFAETWKMVPDFPEHHWVEECITEITGR